MKRRLDICRRLVRDDLGASMVTTAATLPLLIVILLGIWEIGRFMFVKWELQQGTNDAAQYISENARYWNINPAVPADLLPVDWYDYQGKRIVASRLRDILPYPDSVITNSLAVTVTEPLLATGAIADKPLCDQDADQPGDQRLWDEAGFLVKTDFTVPYWTVKIPYQTKRWNFEVRLFARADGHVQCPRWTGKNSVDDLSKTVGSEGPALPFRRPLTAVPPPTVTEDPNPTTAPTPLPSPTT